VTAWTDASKKFFVASVICCCRSFVYMGKSLCQWNLYWKILESRLSEWKPVVDFEVQNVEVRIIAITLLRIFFASVSIHRNCVVVWLRLTILPCVPNEQNPNGADFL